MCIGRFTRSNFRKKFSIDLQLKDINNFEFLSILHSKPLRSYKKRKFKIGGGVDFSCIVCHSEWVRGRNSRKKFRKLLRFPPKKHLHKQKRGPSWDRRGSLYQKELNKVIQQGTSLQQKLSVMHLQSFFQTIHLTIFLPEELSLGRRSIGGWKFGRILPINEAKCYRGKFYAFQHRFFKLSRIFLTRTRSVPINYR